MSLKPVTILKNTLKRKNLSVMIGKVLVRFQESSPKKSHDDVQAWCQHHAQPYDVFLNSLDGALWAETQEVCKALKDTAQEKLKSLPIDMGGGGNYPLLYFFTRYIKAQTVVETGVAAGWSSQAILTALQKNGHNGHLYSSDFPYFRHENPEELVGYVVDEALKTDWSLFIDGDEHNLPKIAATVEQIDLFHYDSDKSYKGRSLATDLLSPKFYHKSIVIFDDIQDNAHFKDYVTDNEIPFKVFEFGGKYIGFIGVFLED